MALPSVYSWAKPPPTASTKMEKMVSTIKDTFNPINLISTLVGRAKTGTGLTGKLFGKTNREDTKNKDPEYTTISSTNVMMLRTGDSLSDIAGKMYNFMRKIHEQDLQIQEIDMNFYKDKEKLRDDRNQALINALFGKAPMKVKSIKDIRPKLRIYQKIRQGKSSLMSIIDTVGFVGLIASVPLLMGAVKLPNVEEVGKTAAIDTEKLSKDVIENAIADFTLPTMDEVWEIIKSIKLPSISDIIEGGKEMFHEATEFEEIYHDIMRKREERKTPEILPLEKGKFLPLPMPAPKIGTAIDVAAKNLGADRALMYGVAGYESAFGTLEQKGPDKTSARGLFQFTDDTWTRVLNLDEAKPYLKILQKGRDDPLANAYAFVLLANDNMKVFKHKNKDIDITPLNLYVGHLLGVDTAVKVLKSDAGSFPALMDPKGAAKNKNVFFRNGDVTQPRTKKEMMDYLSNKIRYEEYQSKLYDLEFASKAMELPETADDSLNKAVKENVDLKTFMGQRRKVRTVVLNNTNNTIVKNTQYAALPMLTDFQPPLLAFSQGQ